ncbi:MAG: arsenate reductase (glutaredoxin) [Caulobacteraceae bacterium]
MSEDFPITIFHNPDCGTSRNVLAIIRAAGYEPAVVEYLKSGWTRPQLEGLLARMHAKPRDIIREKGSPAEELGLLDPDVSDETILAAMVQNPILVNRPIVMSPKGAKLARPSERVVEVLERPPGSLEQDGEGIVPPH